MTDTPEAVERDITSHICYSRFSKRPSHRHHWKRDTLQPDCERCGTLIDREHNEVGPLQWGRVVEPAATPTRPVDDLVRQLVESLRESTEHMEAVFANKDLLTDDTRFMDAFCATMHINRAILAGAAGYGGQS